MNKKMPLSERPKFLPSFIGAIHEESKEFGWLAIFPFVLLSCAVGAVTIALIIPVQFWSESKRELSVAFYVGLLTFNGLILALGWTAFGRIYDALLRGDFGKYLMRNNLLNNYILHITYMHIFQIGAVVASVLGLIAVLLDDVPMSVSKTVFGTAIFFTAYAIKQAVDAVTAMNDLVWQSAFFEAHRPPAAGSNVVPVRRDG
jgi:hypothetical protein